VVELVGPGTITDQVVRSFASGSTYESLGSPLVFAMRPGKQSWTRVYADVASGESDAVCLAWDLVSDSRRLTSASATELLRRCEKAAEGIGRRAFPLSPPSDVEARAASIVSVKDSLDIGFSLSVLPFVDSLRAESVIRTAYELGFRLTGDGVLEWKCLGWREPLLTILTSGIHADFDLSARPEVPGVTVGFSVPRTPSTNEVFERACITAAAIAESSGGRVFDDDGNPLDAEHKNRLAALLDSAVEMCLGAGITPGSHEAVALFSY
jgi:hypothetical protein